MQGTWKTTDTGSGAGTIALVAGALVLAAAVAGPVLAAVAELARAVVIIVIAAVVLAVVAAVAVMVLRLRHGPPRVPQPRVYGSTSVHPVQNRTEPRALPARQEVHLHFHGVTAEEAAAIVAGPHRPPSPCG